MYKKIIVLIILLSTSVFAIDLNLTRTTYAQDDVFQGTIKIEPGVYLATQPIRVWTNGDSKTLQLQNLVNCNFLDCTNSIGSFSTTGGTEPSLSGSSLLTGIKIQKNSIIQNAYFDISNFDSNLPDKPTIDLGNDGSPEWVYPGLSTENFDPDPIPLSTSDFLGTTDTTIITENCQRFTLPKSLKYKVDAHVKKLSSPTNIDIFISDIPSGNQNGRCDQPISSDWETIGCTIDLSSILEEGVYNICLTNTQDNVFLATNSTSPNPNAYVGCSSNCNAVNKNYAINFSAAQYVTTLTGTENFNISNTKKGTLGIFKPLTDLLNDYTNICPLQNNECIIPINISSTNGNSLTVSNLNYKETSEIGEVSIKNSFLSSVTQQSTAQQIILNLPVTIQLSKFNVKTPSSLNTYEVHASFTSLEDTNSYDVVLGPKAKINVSKRNADIGETIRFSASESFSLDNSTLTYFWDFDNNKNSTLKNPASSYSSAGTYVVALTVTDGSDISSTALKTITVGGVTPSQASFNQALSLIDTAERTSTSASSKTKEVYSALNLNTEIKTAKSNLVTLSNAATTTEITNILDKVPKKILVRDSLEISPFLSSNDINLLLPLQDESFKETARSVNEKVTQTISSYLVSVDYLSDRTENFILIRKTIDVPQNVPKPIVMDLLPSSLLPSEAGITFVKPRSAQVTSFDTSKSVRFNLPSLETSSDNEIVYKLSSSNFGDISKIKSIILPENLNIALTPLNCGDNICNPGEDIITCPEDCHCGDNVCSLDETELTCAEDCAKTPFALYASILVILGVIGGVVFIFYKKPELVAKLKIDDLLSVFKSKKDLFSSDFELDRVVDFIKASKSEDHTEKQITLSLTKKGWTKSQVKHALKKSKEKSK